MTDEQNKIYQELCEAGKHDEAREFIRKCAEMGKLCKVEDPTCESCQ